MSLLLLFHGAGAPPAVAQRRRVYYAYSYRYYTLRALALARPFLPF